MWLKQIDTLYVSFCLVSTNSFKNQALPMEKMIHGSEKPTEQMMLFSIYSHYTFTYYSTFFIQVNMYFEENHLFISHLKSTKLKTMYNFQKSN